MTNQDHAHRKAKEGGRWGRIVLVVACVVVACAGMVVVSSALADLGAVKALPGIFSDRPLIANSKAGRFIVRGENMVPGQKVRGQVRIRNRGVRTGILFVRPRGLLDAPGPRGGALSTKLLLTIRRVDSGGGLHTVWKGYLGSMGRVRVGVLRPGAVRRYRFVVQFRVRPPARVFGDDRFQGSRFTTDFVWRIVPAK